METSKLSIFKTSQFLIYYGFSCQSGYVNIFGECGSYKLCGDKSTIGSTTYTSCSNIIQIFYYSTSPPDTSSLRGFNLYYEG